MQRNSPFYDYPPFSRAGDQPIGWWWVLHRKAQKKRSHRIAAATPLTDVPDQPARLILLRSSRLPYHRSSRIQGIHGEGASFRGTAGIPPGQEHSVSSWHDGNPGGLWTFFSSVLPLFVHLLHFAISPTRLSELPTLDRWTGYRSDNLSHCGPLHRPGRFPCSPVCTGLSPE